MKNDTAQLLQSLLLPNMTDRLLAVQNLLLKAHDYFFIITMCSCHVRSKNEYTNFHKFSGCQTYKIDVKNW